MDTAISATDLQVAHPGFLLDIPNLSVERGQIVGLVGRNGAGKTTLLAALGGLLAPSRGQLRVLGLDPIRDVVQARRRVGLMCDDQPVLSLRIDKLLSGVARFYPSWDGALAASLLTRFELDSSKHVLRLSKGEHTRLRLVLAMAFQPELLLLDEPGTGLDVPSRRAMLKSVLEVVKDPQRTVIFSSHQPEDVERVADRVILIDQGRIRADGAVEQVVGEGQTLETVLAGLGGAA